MKRIFAINDLVYADDPTIATGAHATLRAVRTGPYRVIGISNNKNSAAIQDIETDKTRKVHFNMLSHVKQNPISLLTDKPWDVKLKERMQLLLAQNKTTPREFEMVFPSSQDS